MLRDFTVLTQSPFTERGGVAEVFTDVSEWMGISSIIESINGNIVA